MSQETIQFLRWHPSKSSVCGSVWALVDLWMGKALGKKIPAFFLRPLRSHVWDLHGAVERVTYTGGVGSLPATELLGIVWLEGLDLVGYNLEGSKNSGEGHSLHIAGGGIRGSSTGPQGGAGHFMVVVVHWICRFNLRFQFETTWSASINILLAAA